MNEETKNEGQTSGTTQPEVNGASTGGKTFTQDEVNKIISERLAKERAKQEPQPDPAAEQMAQKEKDLNARENRLSCMEYIKEKGLDEALTTIFDTSDAEMFKTNVDKLLEAYPEIDPVKRAKIPTFTVGTAKGSSSDPIAQAFRRK
jgi:hypothetical protein